MARRQRIGSEDSLVREKLLVLATQIMKDEGVSMLTAGRLAERIGLSRQIVHYYFKTIDELIVAVMRREIDRVHDRMGNNLLTQNPLEMVLALGDEAGSSSLELSALALRNETIRREIKGHMESMRGYIADSIEKYAQARGVELRPSPQALALIFQSVSGAISSEAAIGFTSGHADAIAWLEKFIASLGQPLER